MKETQTSVQPGSGFLKSVPLSSGTISGIQDVQSFKIISANWIMAQFSNRCYRQLSWKKYMSTDYCVCIFIQKIQQKKRELLLAFTFILRSTVSRPMLLGFGLPSGAHDQILITVWHFRSSYCEAPSLTRGRVCNLLVQFAGTLRSKSRTTHDHILLSHLRPSSLLSPLTTSCATAEAF
jgi:hypothetical protein